MSKCDHITICTGCSDMICSYCVEDCSGCGTESCNDCYVKHQIPCTQCNVLLCPEEAKQPSGVCAVCEMKNDL